MNNERKVRKAFIMGIFSEADNDTNAKMYLRWACVNYIHLINCLRRIMFNNLQQSIQYSI